MIPQLPLILEVFEIHSISSRYFMLQSDQPVFLSSAFIKPPIHH